MLIVFGEFEDCDEFDYVGDFYYGVVGEVECQVCSDCCFEKYGVDLIDGWYVLCDCVMNGFDFF